MAQGCPSVRPFVLKCYVLRHSAALTGGTGNSAENYTQRCRCFAAMQPARERTQATARTCGSSNLRRQRRNAFTVRCLKKHIQIWKFSNIPGTHSGRKQMLLFLRFAVCKVQGAWFFQNYELCVDFTHFHIKVKNYLDSAGVPSLI